MLEMKPEEIVLAKKVELIGELINDVYQLKNDHPALKCGFYFNPGSILNAYREGDLSFDACVDALKHWRITAPIDEYTSSHPETPGFEEEVVLVREVRPCNPDGETGGRRYDYVRARMIWTDGRPYVENYATTGAWSIAVRRGAPAK